MSEITKGADAPVESALEPAQTAAAKAIESEPSWLPDRLKRAESAARAAVYKDLGITDPASAKATLEAAQKTAEANKSAEQKAAEYETQLRVEKARTEQLAAITAEHSARMMVALSKEQQEAIKAIAGDDPAAQLKAIGVLGPTWAREAELARAATVTAPVPAVRPATTAPAPTAPQAAPPGSPPDHRQIYSTTAKDNPFAAAAYGLAHMSEVYKPPS